MKTELERTKEALAVATRFMINMDVSMSGPTRKHIDDILNPPPEMETVMQDRFICPTCGKVYFHAANDLCSCHNVGEPLEPKTLVGCKLAYQRPKPQPVERIVGVTFSSSGDDYLANDDVSGKSGIFVYSE